MTNKFDNKEAMKLLEKHFDSVLETPGGVKKLRELILTLAMQGKLVEQDEREGTAGELIKEIEEEKKRLVKEGKLIKLFLLQVLTPSPVESLI